MSRRFLAWLAFRCSPNRLVRVDRCEQGSSSAEIAEARDLFGRRGCRWRRRGRGRSCGQRRCGLSLAHDCYAVDHDRRDGLVVGVAVDVRDGGYEKDAVGVALAEDGVLAVEMGHGVLGDEELRAIGAAAGGAGAGVGHGEAAGLVEGGYAADLILTEVAAIACPCAHSVSALDH